MELKGYQVTVLKTVKDYLEALSEAKKKYDKFISDPETEELALSYHFPAKAWEKVIGGSYTEKKNGLKEPLPDFYLKVPTGGGKTLLACHSIDLINKTYLKKQTGLVLWVVPSTQIYRQTLAGLRDREHPYRQVLDISSGGRTLIKEKNEVFTKQDIEESLVILLLMLPSAARQNKETLKVFRDRGGFTDFFPAEEDYEGHEKYLKEFPNLDYFGTQKEFFGRIIKTSLGNTLKVLKPIVIIDEGHKAYSETARRTIRDFNPSIVFELSATPPPNSNKLVEVSGKDLHAEDMIKLDIHLINKSTLKWEDTLLASYERRNDLERKANEYKSNTNEYIRPINLIQVERTGKDQRGAKFIHAEDVKEYLIKKCAVPEEQIAIKSSEKDDIEGIDLLLDTTSIRYIITKQALQEGWDCPFAYILTILTNPTSQLSITQLVGRILRQPYARKTQVRELDECYVFCFRENASELVRNIKSGLESEGMGDIAGRISLDTGDVVNGDILKERNIGYREEFKKYEGKIYLPKFVIQERGSWRDLNYDVDILGNIDWSKIKLTDLVNVSLSDQRVKEEEITYGISENENLLEEHARIVKKGTLEINEVFLTRQIIDLVPNPWIAYDIGKKAINIFVKKEGKEKTASNFVFVIEELRKVLEKERDKLAESVFKKLLDEKKLHFFLVTDSGSFVIPKRIPVRSNRSLPRRDNTPLQKSLLEYVPEEGLNDLEKAVALYLDEQEKLLWWYRNISRQDYHVQGWKRHKIYPDFIASGKGNKKTEYDSVYVLESKGVHLKNEDTTYKKNVFDLCNDIGIKVKWNELGLDFPEQKFEFQVIFGDEWKSAINKIFSN
jgi:type III restriction enzyme